MNELQSTDSRRASLRPIAVRPRERGFCVGATGSGKTTLSEELLHLFRHDNARARTLILDTKPRFRAQFELNGLPAKKRYAKWDDGPTLPNSYVIPQEALYDPRDVGGCLDQIWRLGGTAAIAQVEHRYEWPLIAATLDVFYERYGAKQGPRLAYVDELANFFEVRGAGDAIIRAVSSGRERNFAFLAGSQRPRFVPKAVMTELTHYYLFELEYVEDWKHLYEFGLPTDVKVNRPHVYFYWSKKLRRTAPSARYYTLALKAA